MSLPMPESAKSAALTTLSADAKAIIAALSFQSRENEDTNKKLDLLIKKIDELYRRNY